MAAGFKSTLVLLFIGVALASPPREGRVMPQEFLIHIGSTASKALYTSTPGTPSVNDYATALQHVCPNLFEMEPLAIESSEEFAVIDNWLSQNFDNSSTSEVFWTSGVRFGKLPLSWASTGNPLIQPGALQDTKFFGPWSWNCGILECGDEIPSYSWNKCIGIAKHCNQPRGAPIGCWPLRTEFYYEDCREARRVICQKRI